jgi:hypothetical protein
MIANPKIKKTLLIIAGLSAAAMGLSLYYLFRPYEIKDREAGIKTLIVDIFDKSAKKGFSGAVAELRELTGPERDEDLEKAVLPEINGCFLDQASPYSMIIDPEQYENSVKSLRADMQARHIPDEVIAQTVINKTRKAKKTPDYNAELSWTWADKDKGYVQLVLKISAVGFIEAKTIVTHPVYEKNYRSHKELFRILAWAGGIILAVSLLVLLTIIIISRRMSKQARDSLREFEEKVYRFADAGQFVAAMNEIDKYLQLLPGDSGIMALKNQLLVKTNNNPAQAEKAFNKLSVIRSKLEGRGLDRINEQDLEDLRKISEALEVENLGALLGRVEGILLSKKGAARLNNARIKAQSLIEQGKPAEAVRELEKAREDPEMTEYAGLISNMDEHSRLALPGPDTLNQARSAAEEKLRSSKADLEEARGLLAGGEVRNAEILLKKAFSANKELAEAEKLLSEIEKSRKAEKLELRPEKIGKKIFIFKKDALTIFRKDAKSPDIEVNAGTVSRNAHLKIALMDGKLVAEDQNSKFGTKIGGDLVKDGARREICEGDILNFNNAYNLTAHIYRDCDTAPAAETRAYGGGTSAEPAERRYEDKGPVSSVILEGEDDRIFIMLLKSAPVNFKNIGLVYEKGGECRIRLEDGVFSLAATEWAEILAPGAVVGYKGISYKVFSVEP